MTRPVFRALGCRAFFTLAFILAVSLPDIAGSSQLSGTYINSAQQEMEIPTEFAEFFPDGSFIIHESGNAVTGTYSITGDTLEFVSPDGEIQAFKFSLTPDALMLHINDETITMARATDERLASIAAHKEEEARSEEEERMEDEAALKSAGFIAQSETSLTWYQAIRFCRQQGGRLPLIGGGKSLAGAPEGTPIDGFGAVGDPWPPGLYSAYWTGTEKSDNPDYSWFVYNSILNGTLADSSYQDYQGSSIRAVCVP